jgi:hypothetical protein
LAGSRGVAQSYVNLVSTRFHFDSPPGRLYSVCQNIYGNRYNYSFQYADVKDGLARNAYKKSGALLNSDLVEYGIDPYLQPLNLSTNQPISYFCKFFIIDFCPSFWYVVPALVLV